MHTKCTFFLLLFSTGCEFANNAFTLLKLWNHITYINFREQMSPVLWQHNWSNTDNDDWYQSLWHHMMPLEVSHIKTQDLLYITYSPKSNVHKSSYSSACFSLWYAFMGCDFLSGAIKAYDTDDFHLCQDITNLIFMAYASKASKWSNQNSVHDSTGR